MARKEHISKLPPPFLRWVWLSERSDDDVAWNRYPLSLPLIRNQGFDLQFTKAVAIIVGENGSGKSAILEAIAKFAGFNDAGGGQGMRRGAQRRFWSGWWGIGRSPARRLVAPGQARLFLSR